jgi:hypothetical protein
VTVSPLRGNFSCELILRLSGWNFDYDHKHDSLPGLTWASEENKLSLSQSITSFLGGLLSDSMLDTQWDCVDGGLLSQLSDLDFRFWMASAVHIITLLCGLVSHFRRRSSPSSDRFLGPFNIICTFRTVQPDGPPTIRVFPLRDMERRCQAREIPSQKCKPVNLGRSCALTCF